MGVITKLIKIQEMGRLNCSYMGFSGDVVVQNLPANAEDRR